MNKRPTPETDAVSEDIGMGCQMVNADFARKLERERDEAREKYDTLAVENMLEVHRLCKERDEARQERDIARLEVEEISQELADARKQISGLNNFANERYDEIQKVRKERDKAREDAANYYAKIGELIEELNKTRKRAERYRLEANAMMMQRDNAREREMIHYDSFLFAQREVFEIKAAIIAILEENRHLADGDDCTLAKLKSVVPKWK